jgi:polysaccharide export outer membrane protein
MLFLAVAFTAAGCAQEQMALTPVAAPYGIDNMVYGQTAVAMPAPGPAPAARGLFAGGPVAATSSNGRGLMSGYAAPAPALAPARVTYAPAPAPVTYAPPAPVYVPPPAATYAPPPPGAYGPAAFAPPGQDGPYTLDSGDRLRIVVFGQDGLTNSYAVDASGHIDMPLIGSVMARGATTDQLANRVADRLSQGYIREPHVAVEIEAYRPFFILGEVTAPGQYPYVANMTVETAVAIAGGFGPRGFRRQVTVSRTVGGRVFRFTAPVTYAVRPGDTILVQERWF